MGTSIQPLKKLRTTIKRWWAKLTTRLGAKPVWQLEEGHVIEPAFIAGGVQYYRLKDYFNTFSLRGLQALQVYEEWNMRMTREDLQEFIEKADKVLSQKQINLGEVGVMINMMKERLKLIMPTTDIIYKMASVAFFDKNESPYAYDPEYNKEKIKRWKEAADVSDFFIVMRLKDILPLPTLSEEDLQICLTVADALSGYQSEKVRA